MDLNMPYKGGVEATLEIRGQIQSRQCQWQNKAAAASGREEAKALDRNQFQVVTEKSHESSNPDEEKSRRSSPLAEPYIVALTASDLDREERAKLLAQKFDDAFVSPITPEVLETNVLKEALKRAQRD
mmetsp:Transcript_9835/g.16551  ORF Transcript_9835/g.16551 Transcript_9835/m.16551 type:complete len:128 (-) Transcript_9835:77-460(-)